jgi:hypothetical protein
MLRIKRIVGDGPSQLGSSHMVILNVYPSGVFNYTGYIGNLVPVAIGSQSSSP